MKVTRDISTPLDGMLVYHRVTPSSIYVVTHLYPRVERGTMRVKCLAQQHSAWRGHQPRLLDVGSSTLTISSVYLPGKCIETPLCVGLPKQQKHSLQILFYIACRYCSSCCFLVHSLLLLIVEPYCDGYSYYKNRVH